MVVHRHGRIDETFTFVHLAIIEYGEKNSENILAEYIKNVLYAISNLATLHKVFYEGCLS